MAHIHVTHSLGDLKADLRTIATRAPGDMHRVIDRNGHEGNRAAAQRAKRTAGAHGRHYHRAFSWEMTGPTTGEFGPDSEMPQGGMSFERGSRNQPWHGDLALTADVVGPKVAAEVRGLLDDWFWPR